MLLCAKCEAIINIDGALTIRAVTRCRGSSLVLARVYDSIWLIGKLNSQVVFSEVFRLLCFVNPAKLGACVLFLDVRLTSTKSFSLFTTGLATRCALLPHALTTVSAWGRSNKAGQCLTITYIVVVESITALSATAIGFALIALTLGQDGLAAPSSTFVAALARTFLYLDTD